MGELESDSEVGAVRFSDEGTLEVFDGTVWGPYEPPEDIGLGTVYKGGTGVSPLATRPQPNDPTEEPGS